ncbi:hypothetical protein SAMN05443549_10939 [Flavobacterium fluvii]|uniref:Uncharacterized protein n=1 Tax=Flavobacterium fluvii TaxID=468056 RepID=A0A1M5P206_9FLAO|nr:hypothetical protein SAMN05443549_10939 [Flavobacterium fluvii]
MFKCFWALVLIPILETQDVKNKKAAFEMIQRPLFKLF